MRRAPPSKVARARVATRKLSGTALARLARAHTEVAVQVLAEVATKGSSDASRISAAMALLDRGYGKSATAQAGDGAGATRAPTLFHRIELIDGGEGNCDAGDRPADHQD